MNKVFVDQFKDVSFADPRDNILYDDVLLCLAENSRFDITENRPGNTLRIWESPVYFVVLGCTGKIEDDLNITALKTDGIPVLRRSSGGGTVVQGPGCLNFSFIISKDRPKELQDLRRSYHLILEGVLNLLKDLGVNAAFRPISDLAVVNGDKKFSGNAQKRGRQFILHHGTILYDFDLSLISRYLKVPRDVPEYRKGRPHQDFVTNLSLNSKELREGFKRHYTKPQTVFFTVPATLEQEQINRLIKLRSPDLDI